MKKCLIIVMAATLLVGGALGALEPSPGSAGWQLDFEFHDPGRISVVLPGHEQPTTYWYLLYSVTNRTGREVEFYPAFDLVTDTLEVVEGGSGIHPAVYKAIKRQYANLYPFFVHPREAAGLLRQGIDNKLTSAIALVDFDPQASQFTVYVAGLSAETSRLPNPDFDPDKPESDKNMRFVVLRKSLAVTYELPGDPQSRNLATPRRVKREWVMR
jgi:hypothetical protein